MSDVWIVMIEDRHADVEALPFSSEERAAGYARVVGERSGGAVPGELNPAMIRDGWVLYLPYGAEGDCVRVVKRTMDGQP